MSYIDLMRMDLLTKYKIDYDKFSEEHKKLITVEDINKAEELLSCFVTALNVPSKVFEETPELLYIDKHQLLTRYYTLLKNGISKDIVYENFFVLGFTEDELKGSIDYIRECGGYKYLSADLSLLTIPLERIKELYGRFSLKMDIEVILSAAKTDLSVFEIESVLKICKERNICVETDFFQEGDQFIRDIIKACRECGFMVSETVFLRTPDELKRIASVCEKNKFKAGKNIFKRSADDIEEIDLLCQKYNMYASLPMFYKSVESLAEVMSYIKDNYGDNYLHPMVVVTDIEHVKEMFSYLNQKDILPGVVMTPDIVGLNLDEFVKREAFIKKIGEVDLVDGGFNPIYRLGSKEFNKRIKTENIAKGGVS